MSEHSTPLPSSEPAPFTSTQVKQFDADDAEAGAAIGKMLSIFFLYTVAAMAFATSITYWWITHANG
ncbi:hypothetical protein [Planctomicrobium sp. SH664]|uniref:hypothetical protein n=1 Tax=Planctomicrobium sp. SH664 TaxID=3448125 RepID=UPI003F5C8DA3